MIEKEKLTETLFEAPPIEQQERMVEAILFASMEPVTVKEIIGRLPHGSEPEIALKNLKKKYESRGVNLVKVGDCWALRTAADLGFLMQKESVEVRKLSRAAVETLAIIAYHQPVSRAEIEEIRGVTVSPGTIDTLMEINWVKIKGRRKTPGNPITYGTTDEFLVHFDLENIKELPGLDELKSTGLLDSNLPPDMYPIDDDLESIEENN